MKPITPQQAEQVTGALRLTTLAIGEEGGKPPVITSKVRGEEMATTLAVGEEGGGPIVTTLALGEEGGSTSGATTSALGSF
ncbi:hypothetical protein EYS42_15920 [Aquabacterium lacunae]|uniref:Uncharacterized protein n=1 Tax=Aquabacterium lacunae TaxID=2528630 RepID=A0A4V2JFB8_9BURK|nr:hypothetical protein [Aquabacterium lacunae]TBO27920.1 hypothetical protein EYS42_15920 [Aquabacterium lacunae]